MFIWLFLCFVEYILSCILEIKMKTALNLHVFVFFFSRWRLYDIEKGHRFIRRHSDGTFTSDFTNTQDRKKAKDFVKWLASTKRGRSVLIGVSSMLNIVL
uniref:Glucagon / GIP / secretin / VIP family domain-containing protein n=1 Tax=Periophthalmus magnuspinnatus TaxID=409849 RepID=A0A3B4BGI2_9GOBI